MAHQVKLDVFEGPIDLLLHLITRQRVDIYDVCIATITEEYLAAIERRQTLDLESATGFLVVAASLVELKSMRLLPDRHAGDPDECLLEARDMLLARLVECSTFRDAGMWLQGQLDAGDAWQPRAAGLEPHFLGLIPDLLARTTVEDLAAAAAGVLAPRPEKVLDVSHVAPIRASVKDAIPEVAGRLQVEGWASFADLCDLGATRIDVIVRFLALLELFKAGAIELSQAGRFGDITARWTGAVPVDEVVAEAEEYAVDVEGA